MSFGTNVVHSTAIIRLASYCFLLLVSEYSPKLHISQYPQYMIYHAQTHETRYSITYMQYSIWILTVYIRHMY